MPVTRNSRRRDIGRAGCGGGAFHGHSCPPGLFHYGIAADDSLLGHSLGVLFVEDHLATIEDLDAVKAYDLPSTVDPGSIIAIHELGNFCSPTLDN